MSKAIDDAQRTGPTAERATPGEPGTAAGSSSTDAGPTPGVRADDGGRAPARSRRAADAPVDAAPAAGPERQSTVDDHEAPTVTGAQVGVQAAGGDGVRVEMPTRRQLRLQQVDGRAVAPAPATEEPRPDGVLRAPLPGGRRDRRRRQSGDPAASRPVASDPVGHMSVEDALDARQSIARDAQDHLAGLQTSRADDPFSVDPAVLAQQKALADRAAFLNSRARRTQELSEQNQQDQQRTPVPNDPAAADNLSIVTPPQFVQVPGSTQSVLRAPTTSHIPIIVPRPAQPASAPPPAGQGSGAGRPEGSRAGTVSEPIGARDAFGLDPLDAMTAGLGRLRRVRYLQYSLLAVGATALATGIIMTVSSLNG